jgi:YVTN family beta-propeller protein
MICSVSPRRRFRVLVHACLLTLPVLATASTVRIVQTNSAGDNIHLIDPATNKVVGIISGIEVNHGAVSAPDGKHFYFTNEADHTLDVVDGKTLKVTKHITLSGRPNNLSISPDGRRIYVSLRQTPGGGVDIVDTATEKLARTVTTKGDVHNTFVTPDGKYVLAGSLSDKLVTAIDAKTEQPVWTMEFDRGVRPITFERKSDGSTGRMFVQLTDYHGFVVVDFDAHKEITRIKLPDVPPAQRHLEVLQGSPSHGIGVTPDGKTLWVNSKMNSHVYAYSLPDLKLLGGVEVGSHPDWLTFTPDSKSVYIANAGSNSVSVVDIATRKEVTRVPVGHVPKRNMTAVFP